MFCSVFTSSSHLNAIQDSVFDSLHFIVSLYTTEIIERQQFILAHCLMFAFVS